MVRWSIRVCERGVADKLDFFGDSHFHYLNAACEGQDLFVLKGLDF